jgi:hypothetical protein
MKVHKRAWQDPAALAEAQADVAAALDEAEGQGPAKPAPGTDPNDRGPVMRPLYGVFAPLPKKPKKPVDPVVRPLYGVFAPVPAEPVVRPLYGVFAPVPAQPTSK